MRLLAVAVVSCVSSSVVFALPPGERGRGFVEGANHHLGDASFVAAYGRTPGDRDREKVRMRLHLEHVHAWLASRPATRPELTARRAELLGYLQDYIAAGVTPLNLDVPWRNPVFVDALGNVCAVGYLLERSVSRELVERVAAGHRFDYLEDIDMPEVAAWIAGSGFTLEELASIQPGYQAPVIETWQQWDLTARRPADGAFMLESDGTTTRGRWLGWHMHGPWTRVDAAGRVIGKGTFDRGRGVWTSFDAQGRVIAEGPFARSQPEGAWRFLHPSGRVAAEGRLARGQRVGAWTFYYDLDERVPIAKGRFARGGRVSGTWRHFDARGERLASTWSSATSDWGEVLWMRLADKAGLSHVIAEGNFAGDYQRVDMLTLEGTRLYVEDTWGEEGDVVHDADGYALTRGEVGWTRSGCGWDPTMRRAARRGDLGRLRSMLLALEHGDREARRGGCIEEEAIAPELGARLDRMVATATGVRMPTPDFVRDLVLAERGLAEEDAEDPSLRDELRDLAIVLGRAMTWYVEWPHVDGRFARVFATLPGHFPPGTFAEEEGAPTEGAAMAVVIR